MATETDVRLCADCGHALSGPYCAQCGQSAVDIRRPVRTLVTDFIGDTFVWDGRLWRTLKQLFANPGTLARRYSDGQRARWTPPIRLYLLVSLAFFAAVNLGGLRVLATQVSPADSAVREQAESELADRRAALERNRPRLAEYDPPLRLCGVPPGAGEITPDGGLRLSHDTGIVFTLFQSGAPPEPRLLTAEDRRCLATQMDQRGIPSVFSQLEAAALSDPAGFEVRASAAAGQALVLMVALFGLINLLLHPRTRIIEHVIHSLYLHAALLPVVALALTAGQFLTGATLTILIAAGTALLIIVQVWRADRAFYRSSWYGAALRLPVILVGYVAALGIAALELVLLPVL